MQTTWQSELSKELKSVLKGAQHVVPAETVQNLINDLKDPDVDRIQITQRLRDAKLGWFADRLANNIFHNREQNGNLHD